MAKLDLVEREAVKDAIGFMNLHFLGHGENKSLLDSINEVPAIDAVPVVRCKNCRWRKQGALCYMISGCGTPVGTGDDFFCSYGERRTDETLQ